MRTIAKGPRKGTPVFSASHPMRDLGDALEALRETILRLTYWRAKDKVRAAGDALVRSSDRTYDERNARYMDAKKRVRFLRAELRAFVYLSEVDPEHLSPREADRHSMAAAAAVVRDILGYGTFDLGGRAAHRLNDYEEVRRRLIRLLSRSDGDADASEMLAECLASLGGKP